MIIIINNVEYQYKNGPFIMPTYMNMGMNYYPPPQYMFQQKPGMGMPYYPYSQTQAMGKQMFVPMYYPMGMNPMNNYANFNQQSNQKKEPK